MTPDAGFAWWRLDPARAHRDSPAGARVLLRQTGVATPKGTRALQLPVNATDAVHVYSDEGHIWLQLRRDVPTEQDLGRPSFKAALCLSPGTAHKLALELLNVAERNKVKQKTKATAAATPRQGISERRVED